MRVLAPLARAYGRFEGPGFGRLLDRYGMNDQPRWAGAPTVVTRDKRFGHAMKLDLSDFFHRIAYFVGGYHEVDVIGVFERGLRRGDHVLDGGANIGLLTLMAAGMVGPGGRVDSFEPMPVVHQRLVWHVENNRLSHVRVHKAGLGDAPASFELRLPGFDNKAAATFAPIPPRYGHHVESFGMAQIVRGDDVLDASASAPLLIKLDVEGFEARALRGLMGTVERRRPAIVLESNGELLTLAGSSPEDLFDMLTAKGYSAWAIDRGGFRSRFRLWLHPLTRELVTLEKDVLFLHPEGPHWARFKRCMQPAGRFWRHMGIKPGTSEHL